MSEKFNVTDGQRRQTSSTDNLLNSISNKDWQQFGPNLNSPVRMPDQISFDNSIYGSAGAAGTDHGPLGTIASSLQHDVDALKHSQKGSAQYENALKQLNTDEQTLRQDVFAFKDHSTDFQSFSKTMESYHHELKSVANDLWAMGLKSQASDTTAYFPLSHYEHEFRNRAGGGNTTGGDGGHDPGDNPNPPPTGPGNPPQGQWNFHNLTSDASMANGWGGSGQGIIAGDKNTPSGPISSQRLSDGSMQLSTGDVKNMNGLWWWKTMKPSETAGKSMDWSFDFKFPNGTQNLRCFEADGFKFDKNVAPYPGAPLGTRYMAGTQINFDQGGKLQLWNDVTNHWVDTPLNVGQYLDKNGGNNQLDLKWHVQSGADGRQYVAYDSYTINGHTIDLAHDPATAKLALQPASSRPGIETTIGIQHQLDNTNGSNSVIISNDNFATSA